MILLRMPDLQRDPVADYLAAVERLTRPHLVPITTPDGERLGERLEAPLLQTLAANTGSGTTRAHAGGGDQAHTRSPLNLGAVGLLAAVRERVLADYAELVGGGARPDVIPALFATRLMAINEHRAGRRAPGWLDAQTRRLNGWAQAIADLLDPPMRIEVTSPCPRCGARWVTDPQGDEQPALSSTYCDVHAQVSECRGCGATWVGIDGARRLRSELDASDRMRELLLGAVA